MSDVKKYTEKPNNNQPKQDVDEERKQQAWADFEKSVLEVAEAFFAMSKEEREAMVDYVKNKSEYEDD